MIKTVIFDVDGTLYDYNSCHEIGMKALEQYCRRRFQTIPEEFRQIYGAAYRKEEEQIGSRTAAIHNRLIRFQLMLEDLQKPLFPHALQMYHAYWDAFLTGVVPYPYIRSWMQKLKESGVRIGIGTNMTAYIQYRKLERLGLSAYPDWIVTSEEAGAEKPDRRFFDLCIQKSGCAPEECLFVGDHPQGDAKGALTAGMHAVLYGARGSECPEAISVKSYRTTLEAADLTEFVAWSEKRIRKLKSEAAFWQ